MNNKIRRGSLLAAAAQGVEFDIDNYLTIVALEDGLTASLSVNDVEYSIDGNDNWTTLVAGTATPAINTGQTLSFRGTLTPTSSTGIGTFTISKSCDLTGNCNSLLFGDDAADNNSLSGKNYAFYKLFYNCSTIKNVSSNFLPATTLPEDCYYQMFYGCSSLTTAPQLPATILKYRCYRNMFYGCTSLTTAPALPATTLAERCYSNMFEGCTSLTTAPQLPATTLTDYCYAVMFRGCGSLTTAPQLPATTLVGNCYSGMFNGCTSLTTAPALPATTLATQCYLEMFYNCTSLTTAPALPATTLAKNCYGYMFRGCASLTTAPALPATTLAEGCYYSMFDDTNVLPDCSNINFNSSTVVASKGLKGLFYGTKVTDSDLRSILPINSNGKYYLPCTTLTDSCYECMFYNCKSLTTAPALPATTLKYRCYKSMFYGCKSLTTAPELPATSLVSGCYTQMFYDCSKLNYIKAMFTTTPSTTYTNYWVSGVASSGTFVKNKNATWSVTGVSGIPSNWSVQTA